MLLPFKQTNILSLFRLRYDFFAGNKCKGLQFQFDLTLDCTPQKMGTFGEQGWRSGGAVVRALAFHQCGPGSIPGLDVICGLSLLLVLFSAPRGFSLGTPVFPSPQKPTFLNSNSIRNARAFNT